jgi:hypothetical protein
MERKGVGFSGPEISGPKGMMRSFHFFGKTGILMAKGPI